MKRISILDTAIAQIDSQIAALQSAKEQILAEQRRAIESARPKRPKPCALSSDLSEQRTDT